MSVDLAATLGACVLGIELCGDLLMDAVHAHRPYPSVAWEEAVDRMATGDLVVARGSVRYWGDLVALVMRDVSGVVYGLTAGRDPVPLAAWVRQQVGRGAQCSWRPLRVAEAARRDAHRRISGVARSRDNPFSTLLRAGILSARTTAPDMVNCNTAPGHRFDASIALVPAPMDLDKA